MSWVDDLLDEMRRREAGAEARGAAQAPAGGPEDQAVARAGDLVTSLLEQMNGALLGGRGSVWSTRTGFAVHMWELWWEPARERGRHLVVTLLRDSRGTPYLKVRRRRLALDDPRLERRLQLALRGAFLAPQVYTPRVRVPAGTQDLFRPEPMGKGAEGGGIGSLLTDSPPTSTGAGPSAPTADAWDSSMRARRRGQRNDRDDA